MSSCLSYGDLKSLLPQSRPHADLLDVAMVKAAISYTNKGKSILNEKVVLRVQAACENLRTCMEMKEENRSGGQERAPEEISGFPSYEELVRSLKAAKKSGRYYMMRRTRDGRVQLGLLEAAIAYVKRGGRILSAALKEALEKVTDRLEPVCGLVSRIRILRIGEDKAAELLDRFVRVGILSWAPQFVDWLQTESFRFWLGITRLAS